MTKNFAIYGAIVDSEEERYTFEDLCPNQFRAFIKDLSDDDELYIQMNSPGGSVTAGISIANMIKSLNAKGIKTTCEVQGLAASIASVIMCACDNIIMHKSSFCMIHRCWGVVQGNSEELRKEADIMDKMNQAILSFYRSKFDLTDEELEDLMDAETWFSGSEAENFKLKCEVIDDEVEYKIAACVKNMNFKKLPKGLMKMTNDNVEDNVVIDTAESGNDSVEEVNAEAVAEVAPDCPETQPEETNINNQVEVTDKTYTEQEVTERVSGMQAKMQKQLNDKIKDFEELKNGYEARIKDFENQLEEKNKKLIEVNDKVISLTSDLKNAEKELSEMGISLKAKTAALELLNSNVNQLPKDDDLPSFEEGVRACKTPKEVLEFIKNGKYKKTKIKD